MKFIELTDSETKTPIYVNIESICAIYTYVDGDITIRLKSGESFWVLEEPKKILELIEKILY